ncbi:UTRA domain-containing protein [Roseospira navarrensis]|nr:UTRA domain-containing protein [Roseospira navarrensis]
MIKHRAIRDALLGRIVSGEWAPGRVIPGEVDLAREFGCTRATVARALRELVAAGLVERRRRGGTRVLGRSGRDAVVTIPIVREEIEAAGHAYGYERLTVREADPPEPIRQAFGLRPGAAAVHVACLHRADGRPAQVEDRWINAAAVPAVRTQDFRTVSPNEWLVRAVPYTRARHEFRAERPTDRLRGLLDLAPDEWVFVVERRTWREDAGITVAHLYNPADRFRITTRDPVAFGVDPGAG